METKKLYAKKGQAVLAVSAITTLIVGVGAAVMILIFVGALGGQTYNIVQNDINGIGNLNETGYDFIPNNVTAVSLGHTDIHSGTLAIANSTQALGLGNFTIDYSAGTAISNAEFNNASLTANYIYGDTDIQDSVKSGIKSGFVALKQTGSYLPIVVLAVVISIVLLLVLSFTQFSRPGMGGGSVL